MYGPIQFNVIGFTRDDIARDLIDEVNKARVSGVIRLIDFLFITRTKNGALEEYQTTDLTPVERAEWGGIVGGLIGLGVAGEEGMEAGVELGALSASENDFGLLAEDLKETVTKDLKPGMSAMIVLFEHAWAVPLKKRMLDLGGVPLAQGLISPIDLIAFGAALRDAVDAEMYIESQEKGQQSAKKVKGTKKS